MPKALLDLNCTAFQPVTSSKICASRDILPLQQCGVGFVKSVIVRPSLSPMDSNYMMLRNCPKPDAHDVPIRAAFRGFATRRTFLSLIHISEPTRLLSISY